MSSKNQRTAKLYTELLHRYPDAHCSLHYNNPFQLLVATILSAQSTDVGVNKATPGLFATFPTPHAFAVVTPEEIEPHIATIGLFRNKAKAIHASAARIVDSYDGEVPDSMESLLTLRGVARKTANVVLGNIHGIPSIVVDTHVTRITNLLHFVDNQNAVKIEKELAKILDKNDWTLFAHLLIDHGRAVCIANRPRCNDCVIAEFCPSKIGDS